MDYNEIKKEVFSYENYLIGIKNHLHTHAEVGFDLTDTYQFVFECLKAIGYFPRKCGKKGIIAELNNECKETILFRADMDALPIKDESNSTYKSDINMHACGHDLHTTFLLGAAKFLFNKKNKLKMNVRFAFQPAEEILEGAQDMINDNLLKDINYAVMIHVLVKSKLDVGSFVIAKPGIIAPSCDYFDFEFIGKSVHGALPSLGIDPINVSNEFMNIINGLLTRNYRNITMTYGAINGGGIYNVIPDKVSLKGTLRTFYDDLRVEFKSDIANIASNLSKIYKCKINSFYKTSVPCFKQDLDLYEKLYSIVNKLDNYVHITESNVKDGAGSEDFALVSQKVKTVMINICAGKESDGFVYPLHNSKVIFDDDVLKEGVSLLSFIALNI